MVLAFVLRAASLEWHIILLGVTLLFAGEYWMIEARANAPRDAGQGLGRDAGDDARAQENRLPALRQRLSLLFKVLLVMFLMELKWSWYVSHSRHWVILGLLFAISFFVVELYPLSVV